MAGSQSPLKLSAASTGSAGSTSALLSSLTMPSTKAAVIRHNPKAPGETMTGFISDDLIPILLNLVGEDLDTNFQGDEKTKKFTEAELQQFKLLGRTVPDLLRPMLATRAAHLILGREQKELKDAIALVRKDPTILDCVVTARDRSAESPPLCLMTQANESTLSYDFCLMSDKKDSKVEPKKIYVGMDEKREHLCYQVITPEGEEITAIIDANKLVPLLDLKQDLTHAALALYKEQIRKLTINRGHTHNNLCLQVKNGALEYKVLTPEGELVQGQITQKELEQKTRGSLTPEAVAQILNCPLTSDILHELKGPILEITADRGHTPLGRAVVEKTLLEVAAMTGDFNLFDDMKPEDQGVFEQLVSAGEVPPEKVTEKLKVITSPEAKAATEQRNQRIQTLIEEFGNAILNVSTEGLENLRGGGEQLQFKAFQSRCQLLIDKLEDQLQAEIQAATTLGYIFDPSVLYKAADWFEYGYELCLMPDKPLAPDSKAPPLEKGKLYLGKKDGCITYSVITPTGAEARDMKIDPSKMKAPEPFTLDELNKLKGQILKETSDASQSHTQTNLQRFGGWRSVQASVFGINGIGKLLKKLCACDGRVVLHGIGLVVDEKKIPGSSLNNADGSSHFNSASGLGRHFYLGYFGAGALFMTAGPAVAWGLVEAGGPIWKPYVNQKQQRCKTYATSHENKTKSMLDNVTRF